MSVCVCVWGGVCVFVLVSERSSQRSMRLILSLNTQQHTPVCICASVCVLVCLQFCHWGEYQFTSDLVSLDVYLALDKQQLCRLARFRLLEVEETGRLHTHTRHTHTPHTHTYKHTHTHTRELHNLDSWTSKKQSRKRCTYTALLQT